MDGDFENEGAIVSSLPGYSGDGYGYGGGTILTIAGRSIPFGEGRDAYRLAQEVAARWNAALARTPGSTGEGRER